MCVFCWGGGGKGYGETLSRIPWQKILFPVAPYRSLPLAANSEIGAEAVKNIQLKKALYIQFTNGYISVGSTDPRL